MKLQATNIEKTYKNRTVVKGISFEVNQGEVVGLLGPNGAGKTTSFYMVVGLINPDKGKVSLGDQDITKLAMYKRAKLGIGYLPQEASVFRDLSVEDNIMAILEFTPLSKSEQKERLEELLTEFGLQHVRKSKGNVLSGGERRRTEIARGLATSPKYILLDEPFAGIDPIAVEDIQKIIVKLKRKNIGVLITDHNVQETLSITDRAYLLFEGNIIKMGSAEDLAADEQVRRVYLGENFELKKTKINSDESENKASPTGNLIRQIKDIQNLADQLLKNSKEVSINQLREFSNYNNELKKSIQSFFGNDKEVIELTIIPTINLDSNESDAKSILRDVVFSGGLARIVQKQKIDSILETIREIQSKYASLELILKSKLNQN